MARMPYRNQVVMQGFGVRLPQTLVEQIDMARGDVNRSRYIQRLIENNMNAIVQTNPQVSPPERFVLPSTKGKGDPLPNG